MIARTLFSLWKGRIAVPLTMADILEETADRYNIGVPELRCSDLWHFVHVRQEAMWVMRQSGRSLSEIGRFFDRHHTTVLHAVRAHQARIDAEEVAAVSHVIDAALERCAA